MKNILLFTLILGLPFFMSGQDKKVLFLGNSYTFYNDLPEVFMSLAKVGGYEVLTDQNTPGGCTLAYPPNSHLDNTLSIDKIKEDNWDYVILQEQSQMPVIPYWNTNYFSPGAYALDSIITENDSCSKTMMFMTWGRKYGGMQCIGGYCSTDFDDFAHMTDSLAAAYIAVADELNTPVSPVGIAWKNAMEADETLDLFSADGSHPGPAGTYLAACTFYTSIFFESPVGLEYYADLDETTAIFLQEIAANTVLNNLELWNIDTTQLAADFDYIQDDETVEFTNLSINANSYFWDFGDGNTDTTENPVHFYESPGDYQVDLIAMNDCELELASEEILIIIDNTTDNSNQVQTIDIYPNPGSGQFFIRNNTSTDQFKIDIYDKAGRLVYKDKNTNFNSEVTLNLSHLKPNTYFVHISGDNQSFTERLLIR